MSLTLSEALTEVVSITRYTLGAAQSLNTSSAAGNTGADAVITFNNNLAANVAVLNNLAVVGGIVPYVQAQYNNPTLAVATLFANLKTAMSGTVSWIGTAVNGVPLYTVSATDGSLVPAQFTPAQTAGLRTQLATLITACTAMLPA